jgi:hypothetical protein
VSWEQAAILVALVAGWIAMNRWVLPRFGVST